DDRVVVERRLGCAGNELHAIAIVLGDVVSEGDVGRQATATAVQHHSVLVVVAVVVLEHGARSVVVGIEGVAVVVVREAFGVKDLVVLEQRVVRIPRPDGGVGSIGQVRDVGDGVVLDERAGVHLHDDAVAAHIGDGVVADDQTRRRRPGERVAILGRAAVPALLDAALPGGGHVDPGSVHVLDHVVLDRHVVEPRGFALGGIVGGVDLELDAARAAEVLLPLPVHVVNVEALETVVVTLAVVFEGDDDAAAFVLVVIAFLGVGVGDVQVADLPVLLVPQLDDGVDAAAVDFRLLSFAERVDDDRG